MKSNIAFLGLMLLVGCGGVAGEEAQGPGTTMQQPGVDGGTVAQTDGGSTTQTGDGGMTTTPVKGSATVTGKVGPEMYDLSAAKSIVAVVTDSSFNIYISEHPDLCAVLKQSSGPKSTDILRFGTKSNTPKTFAAGTFPIVAGGGGGGTGMGGGTGTGGGGAGTGMGMVYGSIGEVNQVCVQTGYAATAGSFVTKATVDANATVIEGTFDLSFAIGATQTTGKVTGTFVAPVCNGGKDLPKAGQGQPMFCG